MFVQVTAKNVGGVFLRHSVYLSRKAWWLVKINVIRASRVVGLRLKDNLVVGRRLHGDVICYACVGILESI